MKLEEVNKFKIPLDFKYKIVKPVKTKTDADKMRLLYDQMNGLGRNLDARV